METIQIQLEQKQDILPPNNNFVVGRVNLEIKARIYPRTI